MAISDEDHPTQWIRCCSCGGGIGALLVPARNRLLFGGAVVFIASDLVLAINKFLVPLQHGRVINISLYFIAQFMIIKAARTIWAGRVRKAPVV